MDGVERFPDGREVNLAAIVCRMRVYKIITINVGVAAA